MKQLAIVISVFFLFTSCETKKPDTSTQPDASTQPELLLNDNSFVAVPMPNTLVSDTPFPTDSTLINKWVSASKVVNNLETNPDIIRHGWGIWQALAKTTNQSNNNQQLRRFETWYTPADIIDAYKLRKKNPKAKLNHVKRNTGKLSKMNQLHGTDNIPGNPQDKDVVGFVKYDPTAANHIYDNNLYYESTLKAMIKEGQIVNIKDFPNSGVALKPVFAALDSINPATGLYVFPVWPGDGGNPNRKFDSKDWNNYVSVTTDGESNPNERIYSIKDFISFKLDSAQAAYIGGTPGGLAVLQGMHVTTRETTRWTWQTFWWSENNDTPQGPSSSTIAALRPTETMDRAANHYAMAIAYNMVQPAQNYNGGSGAEAASLYAYNPYLEAGFGKATFMKADSIVRKHYGEDYQKVGGLLNQYGMQTNCMSCHGQARYVPDLYGRAGHFYLTDQYFELNAPYFKSRVKLDFTWSIQGNLINDNEQSLPVK